jgi:predicted metal-dependent phosphoesterase TrpH
MCYLFTMIDLHTHTTCSDGKVDPIALLERAQRKNLTHFSITDHNNVDAYFQIGDYEKYFSGKLVNGIEPECFYKGRSIELLGYDFDLEKMRDLLHGIYMPHDQIMGELAQRCYDVLIKNGIKLSPGIKPENWKPNEFFYPPGYYLSDIIKHPENKKIITCERSWTDGVAFWRNYISNPKSSLFIKLDDLFPSVKTIVDLIKQAGGKVFIPHIFLYGDDSFPFLHGLTSEFEIDGIECYYSKHTKEQTQYLLDFCKENNLLVSAGSDFHGKVGYPDDVGTNVSADMISWLY